MIIRYLRPDCLNVSIGGRNFSWTASPHNLGGITFAIEINQDDETLTYGWSICNKLDNFDKELGRSYAEAAFNDAPETSLTYDRSKSLVSNIFMDVVLKLQTPGTCTSSRQKLSNLKKHMLNDMKRIDPELVNQLNMLRETWMDGG